MTERKVIWNGRVQSDMVDYNGHMNDASYSLVFSESLDALMETTGLDASGRERHAYTIFTLEAHIRYLQEAHEQQALRTTVTILDQDAKRMHLWFEMENEDGDTIATSEQMVMGMSTTTGRPGPFPEEVEQSLSPLPKLDREHWPTHANVQMGIRRK
ncbi:thioesterase family protein [Geomicrobium sp. JCM 19039]|uniref:thioesterase family protein n=1 Tax=Geomicrobium sp. JCM 19039 TaxID=1460636 RepID=UPI00045F2BE9|nr:thioesterase family protein [Geomicrobium sp. JCM 19039]GAK10758.1 3-hydroxyacyl-CoA dehydrogenase [Geomicrobium sp. JCM 19039]